MKFTYTQVGTLLGCAMELCPFDDERERIANHDERLRAQPDSERMRAEFLVDALYEGIVNGDWEEDNEFVVVESP